MTSLHERLFRKVSEYWHNVNEDYLPYFVELYKNGNYWNGEQVNRDPNSAINILRQKIKAKHYYNIERRAEHRSIVDEKHKEYASNLAKNVIEFENSRYFYDKYIGSRPRDQFLASLEDKHIEYESLLQKNIVIDYSCEHIDFSKYNKKVVSIDANIFMRDATLREEAINIIEKTDEYNNYFLLLPETYDLILKSEKPYNPQLIKYGLFIAYMEELFYRERTQPSSRYIFSADEIRNIAEHLLKLHDDFQINRRMIAASVFPLPYIPANSNLILPINGQQFKSVFLEDEYDVEEIDSFIIQDFNTSSGNQIRYHINGSTLSFGIQGVTIPDEVDMDIRMGYVDSERKISDRDFDEAANHLKNLFKLVRFERVNFSKENYKYIAFDSETGKKYDMFRASFGFISNYHVPAIRCDLSPEGFLFYPSSVVANLIGYNIDLRLFVNEKINPFEIVKKYTGRGYSFYLNDTELTLWIEYIATKENLWMYGRTYVYNVNGDDFEERDYCFIPFVCYPPFSNPGYEEWIYSPQCIGKRSLELIQIVPKEHKETLMKHLTGIIHNKILSRKKFLMETDKNLKVPEQNELLRLEQKISLKDLLGEDSED